MAYRVISRRDDEEIAAANDDDFTQSNELLLQAEEERRRRMEENSAFQSGIQPQSSQSSAGGSPGISPMSFAGQFGNSFGSGSSAAAGGGGAASASGGASAGGSAAGGGASSAGGASSLLSFWPAAAVAAVVGNEMYQNNTGNRDDEKFPLEYGITGRALFKDGPVWAEKADSVFDGWGDDIRIAANTSSPLDMFDKDTWKDTFDAAKRGGTLGGIIRKIF